MATMRRERQRRCNALYPRKTGYKIKERLAESSVSTVIRCTTRLRWPHRCASLSSIAGNQGSLTLLAVSYRAPDVR